MILSRRGLEIAEKHVLSCGVLSHPVLSDALKGVTFLLSAVFHHVRFLRGTERLSGSRQALPVCMMAMVLFHSLQENLS